MKTAVKFVLFLTLPLLLYVAGKAATPDAAQIIKIIEDPQIPNHQGLDPFTLAQIIEQQGEGWYFTHSGSNWGFQCLLFAHRVKGYGVVIMTNGDGGGIVTREIRDRVACAYGWDMLDKPIPR